MNAPSQSTQNEHDHLPPLNLGIDFSHRLQSMAPGDGLNSITLYVTVEEMSLRATSILEIMGTQYMDDKMPRISDDGMFYLTDAVAQEIKDMRAIVSAFCQAEHAKNQA